MSAEEIQPRQPALRGHTPFLEKFAEQARGGRLAHGWLLCGPSGIGKARVAQTLAAWLLAAGQTSCQPAGQSCERNRDFGRVGA